VGFFWFILNRRTAWLNRRRKQLEAEVKNATREIQNKNEELLLQNESILSQKDEIQSIADNLLEANKEIIKQKEEIEEINLHMSDSINYAKRIQIALLTPEEYINELFEDYFVLYLPKDIVSGDFYWVRQINEYVVIVVADCTGHGVPGAFMSMLGIAFLNDIVQNQEITQTNQVLNRMRKQVKRSLKQTGRSDEAKDGMDMAVCAINTKTLTMQYAGAYNPVIIIRDDQIHEIKGDRMPVGIHINEKASFTNHEFRLQKNDLVYLFSDGFADQMGGNKGNKLLMKNFKKLLLSNTDYSMYSQKERLLKTFKEWKRDHDQTDDVVVMGIRV
jgi:serine phosphatase RsbU (regulator of sigma subunit)